MENSTLESTSTSDINNNKSRVLYVSDITSPKNTKNVDVTDIAHYIATCGTTKEEMKELLQLLCRCKNKNDCVLFDENVGLYFDNALDDPNTFYVYRKGGVPATIVHYAAVRGRGDILSILERTGVNLHVACRDNEDHIVTPNQVGIK